MSDILREVDDAMRVEKLVKLWEEHKTAIIAGIAALILGTAANSGWHSWTKHQKAETTSAILTAQDSKEPLDALVKAADANSSSYKTLALMTAAAKAIEEKKYDTALAMYDQVIAERAAKPLFRDLAIVQKVNVSLDHGKDLKADDLLKEIDAVAANDKSPWVGQGLMARAVVKAHLAKDIKGAIGDLELIKQKKDLPASLRQRAQALIDTYQLKGQS